MPSTRTLASYLADEAEDKLAQMRDGIRMRRQEIAKEDEDLAFEEKLIENALARKGRRTGSPGGGRVTREQVFEIVTASVGLHFKPGDAIAAMKAAGYNLSDESVRQHLRRMAADGKVRRNGDYYFNPRSPDPASVADNGTGHTQAFPETVGAAEGENER